MIINDTYSGNAFGRIGKGIGQGLSEQLPKELERGRLSRGLEDLSKQEGLTPLQQSAALLKSGFSPEQLQSYLPMLQQQQQRESFLKEAGKPGNVQQGESRQIPSISTDLDETGEIPLSQQIRGKNFLEPMSEEQKVNRTGELIKSGRYLDPERAREYVEKEESTRLAGDQAFQAKQDTAKNEFDKLLPLALQKAGTSSFYDINGDLQRKLANKVATEVARGGNPTQVANKYVKEALDFSKTRQNLRDVGKTSWWNTTAKESLESFDAIKKKYGQQGQSEEFAKDLISYGNMTPEVGYSFAYPVSENKSLNSFINSKKPLTKLGKELKVGSKNEKEIAEYLSKNIDKNDSILSIADRLNDIGLNKKSFFSQVKQDYKDGKLNLNERQARELEQNLSPRSSLGDIFYKSLFFKNPWRQNAK